jgi:hypothetical protein
MYRGRAALCLSLLLCSGVCLGARAAEPASAADNDLRQRLTEREDQRRPKKPWSTELGGRPLFVSGEYEVLLDHLRRRVVGDPVPERDQLFLEQGIETEVFYSFGPQLSMLAQVRLMMEEDLFSDSFEEVSDHYIERGELWVYSGDIAGSGVNVDLGRLNFEDDRRWWWDTDLDALRVEYESKAVDVAVAVARELASERSDRSWIDPEHDRVFRTMLEFTWDWRRHHGLELFALYHSDRSSPERVGDVRRLEREDESDARLIWLGARLMGAIELRSEHILGYWLDVAAVRGKERLAELDDISSRRSRVDAVARRDVRGRALDAGLSWILPRAGDPRLFAGYARGSGDSRPDSGTDRGFRQTGLQANEAGFGGVQRFAHYGLALDPELSNLQIWTLGVGRSLLDSSSLDLVYHYYRLLEPADALRDARIEASLDERHRDLGHGIDLVLAIEEWERFELELQAFAFRAGRAFGREEGDWSYGGLLSARFAF